MNRLWNYLVRLVVGDDVFISYARRDGGRKAVALARQLRRYHLTYYFDRLGSQAGKKLPKRLQAHVRHASMLVVIATPEVMNSDAVHEEVELFRTTKRSMLLMGDEKVAHALGIGPAVLSTAGEIARAFKYTRLMAVRQRVVAASAVIFALIAIATFIANQQRMDAEAKRGLAALEAARQTHLASIANQQRMDAEAKRDLAALEAARQTHLAIARQLANRAVELASDPSIHIEAALLTAATSLRHAPTPDAFEIVHGLAQLEPQLVQKVRLDTTIRQSAISPSAKWFALITDDQFRLYSRAKGLLWHRQVNRFVKGFGNDWLQFSPDESLVAFHTRRIGDRQAAVHMLSLHDVELKGENATAKSIDIPEQTDKIFFTRGGSSLIATRESFRFNEHASVIAEVVDADRPPNVDHEKITALDATKHWLVGLEPEQSDLVVIDQTTNVRREVNCGCLVKAARITGSSVVYVCSSNEYPTNTIIRIIDLTKDLDAGVTRIRVQGDPHLFDVAANGTQAVVSLLSTANGADIMVVRLDADLAWHKSLPEALLYSLRFSGDGTTLVASTVSGARAWDTTSQRETARFYQTSFDVSSDGSLAITHEDKELRIIRLRTAVPAQMAGSYLTGISDDGGVVTATKLIGLSHRYLDAKSWQQLYEPSGHGLEEIDHTGRQIAIVDQHSLRFVDLRTGRELRSSPAEITVNDYQWISAIAFSGNDRWAAVVLNFRRRDDNQLFLVNVKSGRSYPFAIQRGVYRVAASRNGEFIAASGASEVAIYSSKGQRLVSVPTQSVPIMEFSPDASMVVVASSGKIELIDMRTTLRIASIPVEDESPRSIGFLPDSSVFFVIMRGPFVDAIDITARGVHVFNRSGGRIAHLISPWPIYGATWLDENSLRVAAGGPKLQTLTWNVNSAIGKACDSIQKNQKTLRSEVIAALPLQVRESPPCDFREIAAWRAVPSPAADAHFRARP